MTARTRVSPLAAAALAVIGHEADATDLAARLAAVGAHLDDGLAADLLAQLADLGLVRVARGSGEQRRYVPTSLGRQARRDALSADQSDHLAELERLRTELLSTIAHELRTPLTAVRTSVGLLLEPGREPTPEQQRTLLEAIERNADRMQRVVGDILDLARFRAGSVRLQLRRFDPLELAQGAAASLAPLARERDATISIEGSPQASRVYGDRRRLEQALVNLVSNAVRHAPRPAGAVVVAVQEAAGQTRWSVRDEGPGIQREDRARLFERFFVGRSDVGTREGVGLGLPTALAIAQAHGGGIDVESEPGDGSTFTLRVPTDGPEESE